MKFHLVSWSNRFDLIKYSWPLLKRQAKLHGYKLTVSDEDFVKGQRYPAWNKVKILQKVLEEDTESDWIVWIDDDILITMPFIELDWVIPDSYRNKSFIVQNDIAQYTSEPTNTGIWFIRNFDEPTRKAGVQAILSHLYDYGETNKCPLWEQSAFNKSIVENKDTSVIVGRLSYGVIQAFIRDYSIEERQLWHQGTFGAHISGMPADRRILIMRYLLKGLTHANPKHYFTVVPCPLTGHFPAPKHNKAPY